MRLWIYNNEKILVLGGSSLVGHGVIIFFLSKGFKVITTSFNKKILLKTKIATKKF